MSNEQIIISFCGLGISFFSLLIAIIVKWNDIAKADWKGIVSCSSLVLLTMCGIISAIVASLEKEGSFISIVAYIGISVCVILVMVIYDKAKKTK